MFSALERFFKAAECRTQLELADFLGIKQSSISDAKKRKSIPSDWLLILWRKKGINPDWILTGQGDPELQFGEVQKASVTSDDCVQATRPAGDCTMEELLAEIIRRIASMWGKSRGER